MRRTALAASILATCLAGASCVSTRSDDVRPHGAAAVAKAPRTISVTGEAEVLVEPDFVEVIVGTEGRSRSAQEARGACNARMAAVLAAARSSAGIAEKDLATDQFQLEPVYEWENNRQRFVEYVCRKTLVVTLREPERLDALVEALVTAGADTMQGVEFRTSDLRKHRDEARRLALLAAREKADAMAGVLGEDIGAPQSIGESYSMWSPYDSGRSARMMAQNVSQEMSGGSASDEPSSTALGRIRVRASVSVLFELNQ
ncbi:MAG: SIMPL domain-containing protein [Candidatus Sumerlaeia bacterium]|nr:SIMPL domain-containing protein [Candidatus Sumerlaeia bacterium]